MTLYKKPFEKIDGKGENVGKQHFLIFPQCFLPFLRQFSIIESYLFCRLQLLLEKCNISLFGIEVRDDYERNFCAPVLAQKLIPESPNSAQLERCLFTKYK